MTAAEQATRFKDLLGRKEELCAELAACLRASPVGFQYISHPLYCSTPHFDDLNAHANWCLNEKRKAFKEAVAEGKWAQAIDCLVEKPYRIDYLVRYEKLIPQDQYWPLLAQVWAGVENLWQYNHLIPYLFKGRSGNIMEMFRDEDWEHWQTMPKIITIYRGCTRRNRNGWSWTLDLDKAEWFARRFEHNGAVVREAVIDRGIATFYTDRRGEKEVVVNPKVIKPKSRRPE